MKSKNLQELIRNLQIFYKCPSCGASYQNTDIKFLGHLEQNCFMQLTCHNCSLPVLATVFLQSELETAKITRSSSRMGRKADLNNSERAAFKKRGPISSEEIAAFHLFLTQKRQK